MGFRIPAIAISPWVQRKHVAHSVYGFESILKMIEYRFALKPLTRRDAYAQNIARSFDWASKPNLKVPTLPKPEDVVSVACAGGGSTQARAKEHDMMDMVTSGWLDHVGMEYEPPTLERTFREPGKVAAAYVPPS